MATGAEHQILSTEDNDEGWIAVLEDDGRPRQPLSDRVVKGFVTTEGYDHQDDYVQRSALLWNMEWIAKYADMSYIHGINPQTRQPDFIPLGRFHRWRLAATEDGTPGIEMESSVKPPGSPLIDKCWAHMQRIGLKGGFSIGGRSMEKACVGGKCEIAKADIVEIAWTPRPAQSKARITGGNFMAKTEKGCSEKYKRCVADVQADGKTEAQAHAICTETVGKAEFIESVSKGGYGTVQEAIEACGSCDAYLHSLIKSGMTPSLAILRSQSLIDTIRKEDMTMEKDEKDIKKEEPPKEEPKKMPPEEEKKQEEPPKDDKKKPPKEDDKPEEKSQKSDDELTKRMDAVEKSVTDMRADLSTIRDDLKKALSGREDKPPAEPEAMDLTKVNDEALLKAALERGYTVEGVVIGTTPAPPSAPEKGLNIVKSVQKRKEDRKGAMDRVRNKYRKNIGKEG